MIVAETPRLVLRWFEDQDADFLVALLNEPSFLRFIGDRGVRTADDALRYIESGPRTSYAANGHGPYLVQRREDGLPVGLCGLLKRDWLEDADLGFAFLPAFWRQGFALEASRAMLVHARALGIARVVAITSPDNDASGALLVRLGFVDEGRVRSASDAPELRLYGWTDPGP